jgi:hypothetical protein
MKRSRHQHLLAVVVLMVNDRSLQCSAQNAKHTPTTFLDYVIINIIIDHRLDAAFTKGS